MLQFLIGTDIPFMKYRRFAYGLSGGVALATVVWLLIHQGPRLSVDFTGGTLLLVRAKQTGAERQDIFPTVQRAIESRFPGVTVELRRTEAVGPKVGNELRQKAIWAILGSLGGILLYVGIRYEFKFAIGAVVALFDDVFVTLGVLCFTGREVSLTVVAALLTIAGYSINDTIVVFDRIRERAKALRKE